MKISTLINISSLLITLSFCQKSYSQSTELNNLDQNITISAENVTIAELLSEIGSKAGIKFSYNPKKIRPKRRVSVESNAQPVRYVLNSIFEGEFDFKLRGNYVIIVPVDQSKNEQSKNSETLLSGYILDEETEDGIADVSVFTSSGANTLSDQIGAFSIKLKKEDNSVIQLRKKGFESIMFETTHSSNANVNIRMRPIKRLSIHVERPIVKTVPITSTEPKVHLNTIFPINSSLKTHQENIPDTLTRPVSLSLYPGLSTYSNLSGNIEFNFALNFVGYNRGINGLEMGVISNINKEDVNGVTLAGINSYVGGNIEGFQSSGIFNVVGGDVNGLQMAGISNATIGHVEGAQFAGISNHAQKNFNGLQISGIYNQTDTIVGSQIGGIMNLSESFDGLQVAGILNMSSKSEGLQVAGIMNMSDEVDGAQISGILNMAGKVDGSQIGLINVADSISGVPIGLFSFVKKDGYMKIGLFADELFPVNLSFSTGVRRFHNILFAGVQTDISSNENAFYTFGYGVGSTFDLSRLFALDFDLTGQYITKRKFVDTESILFKSYLGLELNISDKISIAGGATFNAYYFDHQLLVDEDFNGLRSSYLFGEEVSGGDNVWRGWIGFRGGIRYTL